MTKFHAPFLRFSDVAFLERNWDKDQEIMTKSIEGLSDYPDPVWLLIFAEGTRMNPEKLEASRDFARSRNLPVLRHCKFNSIYNKGSTVLFIVLFILYGYRDRYSAIF